MKSREEVIQYCLTLPGSYEDHPFRDHSWTVIRHRENKKIFAWIYHREERLCVNVKCDPEWIEFWRGAFPGVLPGYHLNKKHWNTLLLDGSVPDKEIRRMIGESYDLTKKTHKEAPSGKTASGKSGGTEK